MDWKANEHFISLYTDLVVLQCGETFDNNDYGSDNNGGDG